MPPTHSALPFENSGLLPLLLALSLLGWLATAAWLLWALRRLQEYRRERHDLVTALAGCVKQSHELSNLRAQLNSHFLFNALNTIRYFVRTDTQVARGLLLDLSEFLKGAVDTSECGTLGEELDRATSYLSLESARLGNRLELRLEIDDAPSGRAFPTRVLQPLMGLMLKRGPQEEEAPWWIGVRCRPQGQGVQLTLADNSPHLALPEGTLNPLKDRLQRYCPGATLVEDADQYEIKLTLP